MGTQNNRPVTRAELRRELKRYPTRKDLRAELKAALKNYATKNDLKRFATKDDLKRYATKKQLDDAVSRLSLAIVNLQTDLADVKERMATKEDINQIMSVLDHLVVTYEQAWNKLESA